MGQTSKKLHRKLKKMAAPLGPAVGGRPGRPDMPSIEKFIEEGLDPVHAAYVFVQHITSQFSEGVSQLPEMRAFTEIVAKAEDEYLPSGPPMSPLTGSYFTGWAFFDLQFDGNDTLANCLIDANDLVCMNPDQLDALQKMSDSRMGIYEHVGNDGKHVRLKELITGDEFTCHSTSGYRGKKGELWYVRLLPPLLPELADYHIVFTTPYVLIEASKDDWMQFLGRSLLGFKETDKLAALHRFLKHGPDPNFWNEFVFKAYHHHQHDAVFLAGIPDLKATLPHA
jgi:hypothetical protein